MSRPEFDVKEQWIGTGLLTDYTFDFKIEELTQLLIYVQDDEGEIVSGYPVRGDDTTVLSGVVFDAVAGGGTVTLLSALTADYTMTLLLANDLPTQPSEFKGKGSLTLPALEAALDWLGGAIQRISYLAQRSLRLSDMDDESAIDLTLPPGFADNPGAVFAVDDFGTGVTYGPTLPLTTVRSGPFTVLNNDILTFTDELFDHTLYTQVDYVARVVRGTTVFARCPFSLFYRNGAWELVLGVEYGINPSGITWEVGSVSGQLRGSASNGPGDAIIDFEKTLWAAA